jgi:hypothetical protein
MLARKAGVKGSERGLQIDRGLQLPLFTDLPRALSLGNRASGMMFSRRPLTALGLLALRCLRVEGDTHRFGEGEINRAPLLPSLIKLLDIAFAVRRLHPDVEVNVL